MKKEYPIYSFRLNEKTIERMREIKSDYQTWNRFFMELIDLKIGKICSICGSAKKVEKHHINKNETILLCFKCHKKTDNWGVKGRKKI